MKLPWAGVLCSPCFLFLLDGDGDRGGVRGQKKSLVLESSCFSAADDSCPS